MSQSMLLTPIIQSVTLYAWCSNALRRSMPTFVPKLRFRSLQKAQSRFSSSCVVFPHKFLVLVAEIIVVEVAVIMLLRQHSAPFEICSGPPIFRIVDSLLVCICLFVLLERFQKIVHYSNCFVSRLWNTVRVSNYWQLDKLLQQEPAARDVQAILPHRRWANWWAS